jgi:Nif-specific regulatory protein
MSPDPIDIVSNLAEALGRSKDSQANIRACLGHLHKDLGLLNATLFLYRPDLGVLSLTSAAGLDVNDFRRLENRSQRGKFQLVLESGELHTENHLARDPELGFLALNDATARQTSVPVRLNGKTEGVLAAVYGASAERAPQEIEKIIALAASMIGQTLRIESSIRSDRERLLQENTHLKQELREKYDFTHIVGTSNPMKQVYDQVTQVARSNATVLLRGESGTGKEMIANAIHYNSLRSKRPLVKINCAALPDTLIEAELFGHEKGAFTGADRLKRGRFELAEGGTLFLDEIGDLPLQTQIKLLRVLQEREFERLGGMETIKTNIRLIAATNKNLEKAIANGQFREDLYYRLNVFTIFLPPLRERKSDILLLAEHFLEKYEREHEKRIRRISTPAIDMLMSYHFPGNVRELENAIERAVLVCDSNVIHGHHLPPTLQTAELSGTVTSVTLASAVQAFERDLIQDTLKSTRGNIAKAAKQLDSTERILGYKIKKYGIDTLRFRR